MPKSQRKKKKPYAYITNVYEGDGTNVVYIGILPGKINFFNCKLSAEK